MKVYNQYETGRLLTALVEGDAEVKYAREDEDGFVHCTIKWRLPKSNLPKLEAKPTI